MTSFINDTMPGSRKKRSSNGFIDSPTERLATIHSNCDDGSSGSDNDSDKNGDADSDCQDFNEREQQDIFFEVLN